MYFCQYFVRRSPAFCSLVTPACALNFTLVQVVGRSLEEFFSSLPDTSTENGAD